MEASAYDKKNNFGNFGKLGKLGKLINIVLAQRPAPLVTRTDISFAGFLHLLAFPCLPNRDGTINAPQ